MKKLGWRRKMDILYVLSVIIGLIWILPLRDKRVNLTKNDEFFQRLRKDSITKVKNAKDCSCSDIEKNDSCLLGTTIGYAIGKLKIDTSQFYAFDEPPDILRGININLGDTCEIELHVNRTSIRKKPRLHYKQTYIYIINEKIIGVTWEKPKKKKYKHIEI